eukprot:scaffold29819_cov68-Cyclotella_meneghiniana.AAC.2
MKYLHLFRSLVVPLPLQVAGRRYVSVKAHFPHHCTPRRTYRLLSPAFTFTHIGCNCRIQTSCLSSTSSSFRAPEPPQSHGKPIFPDVPINATTSQDNIASIRNEDPDAVFVVNGSSRGIGLQFIKSLLQRTKGKIVACCRTPDKAYDLQKVASDHPQRIQILPLDVEQQSTIDKLAKTIANDYQRVDGLFNVAGILGDGVTTPGPERSLAMIERDWLEKSLAVNVIGPVMLTKALSPMMRTTGRKSIVVEGVNGQNIKIDLPPIRPPTIVANLSARVGSISDNRLGGWYSYRLSKSALNQSTKTMGLELKRQGTWILALHPGTTDTDLSMPFQKNVQKERLFPVHFT